MNLLYDSACSRAAALIRVIQRRRNSTFFARRSRYAYFAARSVASLAAFQSLLRPPQYPLASFITLFLRFRRATLLLTRGMVSPYACNRRLRRRSACDTSVALRRWRLRFAVFDVALWRLKARYRLIFPVPVKRTRFRSARLLFIFGIATPISVRGPSTYCGPRALVLVRSSRCPSTLMRPDPALPGPARCAPSAGRDTSLSPSPCCRPPRIHAHAGS